MRKKTPYSSTCKRIYVQCQPPLQQAATTKALAAEDEVVEESLEAVEVVEVKKEAVEAVEVKQEAVEAVEKAVVAVEEAVEAADEAVVDVVVVDELLMDVDVVVEEATNNLTSMKLHGGSVVSGWVHQV